MNAGDSLAKRDRDLRGLETFIRGTFTVGQFIPMNNWHEAMRLLGLELSSRQRLSELRKKRGLMMKVDYEAIEPSYRFMGWSNVQQDLVTDAGLLHIGHAAGMEWYEVQK